MIKAKKERSDFSMTRSTNTIKKRSIKEEKSVAKEIGAKLTPQSGAKKFMPGDMYNGEYLIEHKGTDKKNFTITHEILDKATKEAFLMSKTPVIIVTFQKSNLTYKRWILTPLSNKEL